MSMASRSGARPAPLSFIQPMRAVRGCSPPAGDDWSHEIEHDGDRVQILISWLDARAFSEGGHELGRSVASILEAAVKLDCTSAIIDGILTVQDEGGKSDRPALETALLSGREDLVFVAFDLLQIDGADLRDRPLSERRDCLRKLMGVTQPRAPLQFSRSIEAQGPAVLQAVSDFLLKGVVSKRKSSVYRSGHSGEWIATRAQHMRRSDDPDTHPQPAA